tara:strand:+ start:17573 stop:17941 length:369 start_codon:yes stop_codon:yes gene_type:complete
MYQTDFICTYKNIDDSDQEDLYRIQLLQAFNIDTWDDEEVNNITEGLFNQMATAGGMKDIITKCREYPDHAMLVSMMGSDDLTVFRLLFKFELFDFMHKCIVEYIKTGRISSDSLANITKNL